MCYPFSESEDKLPSLPSNSPEGRHSPERIPTPIDPDLSIEEADSPVHSTPSTPEGQAAAKRVKTETSESDNSDENQPSTSDATPRPKVQQRIL